MLGVLAAVALTLGLVGAPAGAASLTAQPTAVTEGGRVVITIQGKKPMKATLIVGGTRYQLKRKGKVWRTKPLSAEALAGMSGAKAKVKVRVKGKNKTLKTSIQGTGTNPTTPGGGTQPPFAAPGVDREGEQAWEAIKGYFLDSTFTNCPAGWPSCFSEERYGHFANFSQAYCRLTSAEGPDIINPPKAIYVSGAEQKADGSWGVSYDLDYGDNVPRQYLWRVAADGSVEGLYSYNGGPAEPITGLVWMRGAKDCRY